ncbi:McrC family protein [Desertivirga xinjiangensis]|uniref:McrC family protein n=1 Tax=Desertivirga xinjiangensis TaxID=539206 RepID=UPI00210A449E|nr:McrC family protein [Pedobacter xinjiangensis]
MAAILRFFEYDRIKFNKKHSSASGSEALEFTTSQINALRAFHTSSEGKYYDLIDNGIQFKEQVGVLQINQLTIEVLPKIDRSESDKAQWHDLLLNMLKECKFIQPESTGYASLKLRSNSILDFYFEKYLNELEQLLNRGLIKRYRSEEGNQNSLKGKLLFNEHIRHNLVHAERFYVEYGVYDSQHLLHQVLRQALEVVCRMKERSHMGERLSLISSLWPDGKTVKISEDMFKRFSQSRKLQPYQEALQIAKLLLLNYHPDLRGGKESVLAVMFNMNELWEEFIHQRLKSCEKVFGWRVRAQRRLRYWQGDNGGKLLIPDIVIECAAGGNIIIDTKWKRPDRKKPNDDDLRQLLAYKLYYEGHMAYLLYPSADEKGSVINGEYNKTPFEMPHSEKVVGLHGGLLFLNVLEGKGLISKKEFKTRLEELLPKSSVFSTITSPNT